MTMRHAVAIRGPLSWSRTSILCDRNEGRSHARPCLPLRTKLAQRGHLGASLCRISLAPGVTRGETQDGPSSLGVVQTQIP